jgi:hypothetical protein
VGAMHSMAVILTLVAWFGSLIAMIVLVVILRNAQGAQHDAQQPGRTRVRTIDRLRAAARWASWREETADRMPRMPRRETIDRMPGISRQQTALRPGPAARYPMAQRGQRPPGDAPRRSRSEEADDAPRRPGGWAPDSSRRYPTLESASTVVQPRPGWRTPPAPGRRDQSPPPRDRRTPYDR